MKLRKILARMVAIASCVAMLSTNAFAAIQLSRVVEDGVPKLQVTVTGTTTPWVSLLAVDEGAVTGTWAGNSVDISDIQNADQADDGSKGTVVFEAFGPSESGADKVDLFVNGTLTDIQVESGIYIRESVTPAKTSYTYKADLPGEFEGADLAAFFAKESLEIKYNEVGKTESECQGPITLNSQTTNEIKQEFAFSLGDKVIDNNKYVYPVTVSYNGTKASDVINVTEEYPAPVTAISVIGATDRNITYYADDITDYDTTDEVAVLAKSYIEDTDNFSSYKVEVTRKGDTADTDFEYLENKNLVYIAKSIADDKYEVSVKYTNVIPEVLGGDDYTEVTAAETFTFTIIENAIESAINTTDTTNGTPNYSVEIPAKDWPLTTGADDTVAAIFNSMTDGEFAAENLFSGEFVWNNPDKTEKPNQPIKRGDLVFTAADDDTTNENEHTFIVTITLKDNDKFLDGVVLNPVASFTVTATKEPFEIISAQLKGVGDIPAKANDGYNADTPLPATAYVSATIKLDGVLSDEPITYNTFYYYEDAIPADAADGVWISKASVADINDAVPGTYYLDATIVDSKSENTDKKFSIVDERLFVKVIEAQPLEPLTVTSDGRTIEVPYGSDAAAIEQAIRDAHAGTDAAADSDLFVTEFTNDTTSDINPDAVEYTIPEGGIDVAAINGRLPGDYEATVAKVVAGDGTELTPTDNTIKVKVNPATIKEIVLIGDWVEENQQETDNFPGFSNEHKIGVIYDADTCVAEPVQDNYHVVADIVEVSETPQTDTMTEDTAYINTEPYDSRVVGWHTLNVYIKDDAIGGVYSGNIQLEVLAPIDTNKIALIPEADIDVWCAYNPTDSITKDNAKAAVEAAIKNDSILKVVMTNGAPGSDFVTGYELHVGEIDGDIVPVTIAVTDGIHSFKDPAKNIVNVKIINNLQLKSAKFVNNEGTAVTPSIKAAISPYETNPALLEMDWSSYKIEATYPNPTTGELTETDVYEYKAADDKTGKYFTVSGWTNFKDGGKVGDQTVTIKIYDVEKVDTSGYALTGTLKATIVAADEPSTYVKVKSGANISVAYGTEDAISAIKASTSLIQQIYKDGTAKDSTIKVTGVTITDYKPYVAGSYTATVTAVENGATVESGALKVTVNAKYTPSVVNPGTVIGGGGTTVTVGGGGGGGGTTSDDKKDDTADTEDKTNTEDKTDAEDNTENTTGAEDTTGTEDTTPVVVGGDIPAGHFAENATKALITKGVISGDQNGNVNLDATFTRAQIAKIAAVIHSDGGVISGGALSGIADAHAVPEWSEDYVSYVVENGIITGHADGTFDPNGMVSRAQLATILLRLYGYGEGDGTNLDAYGDIDASHWARAALSKCVELGIMSGYEDSTMKPDKSVTTAEACVMIDRAMALYEALQAAISGEVAE